MNGLASTFQVVCVAFQTSGELGMRCGRTCRVSIRMMTIQTSLVFCYPFMALREGFD
jgi:hypothetical protein